jgi:hypothetical protein
VCKNFTVGVSGFSMPHTGEHRGSGKVSLHGYRVNVTLREAIKPPKRIAEMKVTHIFTDITLKFPSFL